MQSAENIRIVLFVVANLECWVHLLVADRNVLFIRIVPLIELVLISDAVILVLAYAALMLCAPLKIISLNVHVSMVTKEIHTPAVINNQVSAIPLCYLIILVVWKSTLHIMCPLIQLLFMRTSDPLVIPLHVASMQCVKKETVLGLVLA